MTFCNYNTIVSGLSPLRRTYCGDDIFGDGHHKLNIHFFFNEGVRCMSQPSESRI